MTDKIINKTAKATFPMIIDVSTLHPSFEDVIVVKLSSLDRMPMHRKTEYMEHVVTEMERLFPKNKIMIIDSNANIEIQSQTSNVTNVTEVVSIANKRHGIFHSLYKWIKND